MRARLLCLLTLPLAVAVLVAGCGGGEGIPPKTAAALVSDLDSVERGVREGECERTQPTLRRLEQRARALPSDVDRDVRATLARGVQTLEQLFKAECKQKPEPVPEPEPEPVAPPPAITAPEPEPTAPEPEEPTVTEPEEPTVTEPEEPKLEEPKEPDEPKPDKPTDEEIDICGENPAPTC
jgi:hypothetical protein